MASEFKPRLGDEKRTGVGFVERRSEPRMMCSELVEVYRLDKGRWRRLGSAVLEDISPGGACIQLEQGVPVGSQLRVKARKMELLGEVRWCQYREFGYFAGLKLDARTRWSRSAFEPEHLLDPSSLKFRDDEEDE